MALKFVLLFFPAVVLIWSCHLDDFDLDKLTDPDITPNIEIPLVYGTFKTENYLPSVNLGNENDVVTIPQITLDNLNWDKENLSFKNEALDDVVLVVNFTNYTPVDMDISFYFINKSTGSSQGNPIKLGKMPAGITDSQGKVIQPTLTQTMHPMSQEDLKAIKSTDQMKCIITLSQPENGTVVVKYLKQSTFEVRVSLRSRLLLKELN